MNQRLYRKIATRLYKIEKLITETSILLQDLDGGLSVDLARIGDDVLNAYEVLDERRDKGEYEV